MEQIRQYAIERWKNRKFQACYYDDTLNEYLKNGTIPEGAIVASV